MPEMTPLQGEATRAEHGPRRVAPSTDGAVNPVWGVHVVGGAVTAALVRRTDAGGYEILEAFAERAAEEPAEAVALASTILSRRGMASRGAFVALPDSGGCLVTATIPPEEMDLSEHEISNELYEWTPFEPSQAELRHQCVLRDGRRQDRLVATLPRADYRRYLEILEKGDASRLGVGFAGAATWRGAKAMGLVPPDGFLVAMLPRVAEVYATPTGRARRRLLPVGEADIARDATAVDVLGHDLAQLAVYHRSLHRDGEKPPNEPQFALAGLSATSPAVRQRLAAVLGPRLVDGVVSESVVTVAPKAKLANLPLAAFAGAVGAAIEALRPFEERLVLRHVPADLPPYRKRTPLLYFAGAAALLVGAAAVVWHEVDLAPHDAAPRAAHDAKTAVAPAADRAPPQTTPSPPVIARPAAPAPTLEVETTGPGRVRVRWSAVATPRALRRRFLGREGDGSQEPSIDVRKIETASGECLDDVPGVTGLYAWSVDRGDEASAFVEARAFVEVRVDVELLGPGDAGGAQFLLRRPWREGTTSLAVDVSPGGRVSGVHGELVFDSGLRLDAVRTRSETEQAAVRVPRFLPDGRVERGADGSAATGERVVVRERRVFEADAVAPDGSRRTWSRKMTDG